jgi:hypothetical protein
VWVGGDYGPRDALITQLNVALANFNFSVRRGWQPYDPVVVAPGNAHYTYAQICNWAAGQGDGGRAAAQSFLDWYSTGTVQFDQLPVRLQALAVITHFAEVGRGYSSALAGDLYPWMEAIAGSDTAGAARHLWGQYNARFSPSLAYAVDLATEYA